MRLPASGDGSVSFPVNFNLARRNGKLVQVPHIPMLKERNMRTGGQSAPIAVNDDDRIDQFAERGVEAPPGFEPGVEVLQTSALPLGDGAP